MNARRCVDICVGVSYRRGRGIRQRQLSAETDLCTLEHQNNSYTSLGRKEADQH